MISLQDFVRIVSICSSIVTYVLAIAILVVSFQVLNTKPFLIRTFFGSGAGFLFIHILLVTISFQGFVTWGAAEVLTRIGEEYLSWRSPVLLFLTLLMNAGYVIIFRIELARLRPQSVDFLLEGGP